MRIKSIRVENFRSVQSATLELDGLTALVGANGAGKSTFLRALLAFQGKEKPCAEDFYNRDTTRDITIAVTFTGLSSAAGKKFARYLHGGNLEVTRVYKHSSNSTVVESSLHGRAPRNGDFDAVRAAASAGDTVAEYDKLRGRPEYATLPKCKAGKAAREALTKWEDDNSDKCERLADDGSFFGFEGAAEGRLDQFIRMLYVPAVREATGDGTEGGRGSVLHELLELTVKGALAGSARHQRLQKEADALYKKARNMGAIPEVKRLEAGINGTLGTLARGARADIDWDMQAPRVGLPTATIRLTEDGYSTTIDRTGHGLQRAFIIAMLGRLHGEQTTKAASGGGGGEGEDGGGPSIVLAIEEPELYQHPTQARHIAGLLSSISRGGFAGVAKDVQVIYTTHSPYFVGADRIGRIRLLRKAGGEEGMPKATRVWSTDMDKIRKRLAAAGAAKHADPDKLEHDFDRVLTPLMSEGFFAGTAVLVEGDSDRIAITRAAEILGTPLDEQGVVVIPCGSKTSLPGPLAMFKELGVQTYAVWDGDNDKPDEKKRNRRLLSLLGIAEAEAAGGGWLGGVTADFACHETKLEGVLRSDMGKGLYDELVAKYKKTYRLKDSDEKKPLVTHLLMREMERRNVRPAGLGRIVEAILAAGAAGSPEPA